METRSLERIVAEHPFFADLEAAHTNLLAGCASNVHFARGAYILREGQEANEFYLVREGRVAVEISAPHRKPVIVDTVGAGEIQEGLIRAIENCPPFARAAASSAPLSSGDATGTIPIA
jgi:hypothetical protein